MITLSSLSFLAGNYFTLHLIWWQNIFNFFSPFYPNVNMKIPSIDSQCFYLHKLVGFRDNNFTSYIKSWYINQYSQIRLLLRYRYKQIVDTLKTRVFSSPDTIWFQTTLIFQVYKNALIVTSLIWFNSTFKIFQKIPTG